MNTLYYCKIWGWATCGWLSESRFGVAPFASGLVASVCRGGASRYWTWYTPPIGNVGATRHANRETIDVPRRIDITIIWGSFEIKVCASGPFKGFDWLLKVNYM
jgi:hypothetical protein